MDDEIRYLKAAVESAARELKSANEDWELSITKCLDWNKKIGAARTNNTKACSKLEDTRRNNSDVTEINSLEAKYTETQRTLQGMEAALREEEVWRAETQQKRQNAQEKLNRAQMALMNADSNSGNSFSSWKTSKSSSSSSSMGK